MPPEIRPLADHYLYDPLTVEVESATLTIDTVEQFPLAVPARDKPDTLVACSRPSSPTRPSSSCARRSAATSSSARCATRGWNVRDLHGDMTQGARDGVMLSFKEGRCRCSSRPTSRARPRHLDRHPCHQLRRPTSPDIYVHRIGRTGRVGAPDERSPSSRRARSANSRRSSATSEDDRALVGRRDAAPAPARRAPAPPLQAATSATPPMSRARGCLRAAGARPGSRSPTSSPRSRARPRWTARRYPT